MNPARRRRDQPDPCASYPSQGQERQSAFGHNVPMHRDLATGGLGEFLRSRRAGLTPEDVGIPSFGARRVPGLRREELAQLAGVSLTYYTRLEQGQASNASASVVDALARALQLDEDECAHLHALAGAPSPARRTARPQQAHPRTRQLLDAMPDIPAVVMGPRTEVLAWNPLGHALLAGHTAFDAPQDPRRRPNLTRMLFLDPHMRELHRDWAAESKLAVSSLRFVAAELRDDRELAELIGELTLNSSDFATLWAKHPVQRCTTGIKRLHHPAVGDLDLDYHVLHLPDTSGQRLLTHTAAAGSSAAAGLTLLRTTVTPVGPPGRGLPPGLSSSARSGGAGSARSRPGR
jgi:transcriptional regulator with XRE-family HTH domain